MFSEPLGLQVPPRWKRAHVFDRGEIDVRQAVDSGGGPALVGKSSWKRI